MIRKAFIQAGGSGSRLRPITLEIPKPLIPVQGLPILTWQARWFARYGVDEITVIIPPKWQAAFLRWRDDLEDVTPKVTLVVEPVPMGTLGAFVHHLSKDLGEDPVFVTNGDELKGLNLSALTSFHLEHDSLATVALIRVPNPSDYGVAEMSGSKIRRFHEKPKAPPSNLVSSGLYVLDPEALDILDHSKSFLMFENDLFPPLAEAGNLAGCVLTGPWFDCGTLERWERAINEWQEPADQVSTSGII